jgi:hypothetical protein
MTTDGAIQQHYHALVALRLFAPIMCTRYFFSIVDSPRGIRRRESSLRFGLQQGVLPLLAAMRCFRSTPLVVKILGFSHRGGVWGNDMVAFCFRCSHGDRK